jgi:hypothetical protein
MDDLTKNLAVLTTQGGTPKGTPRTQIEQAYDALTAMETYMHKYDNGGGTVSLDELGAARELVRRAAVHDAQREVAWGDHEAQTQIAYRDARNAALQCKEAERALDRAQLHGRVAVGVIAVQCFVYIIAVAYAAGMLS